MASKRLDILALLCALGLFLGGCVQSPHMVHISTDPSGALVFLNDKVIGETPMDTIIEQRKGDYNIYNFRVMKEDYIPVKKMFKEQRYQETVHDLIPEALHFVLEERKKYPIYITSEPSGAMVSLNGETIGETPFTTIVKERIGNVRVFDFVVVKEGYQKGQTVLKEFLPQENGPAFIFPETLHFELKERVEKDEQKGNLL